MTRRAVVIPGANFGPHTPTLAYPRFAAEARGAEITAVEWSRSAGHVPEDARTAWVEQELATLPWGDRPLLIGRSLGTCAAGLAAVHALPAIWISPLLTSPDVVAALERASAPVLLIGGDQDPYWDGAVARRVAENVLELPDAGHGLMIEGSLVRSAEVLATLSVAVETFLDALPPDAWLS